MRYLRHYSTRRTPQSRPIPGSAQVANSAGGYAYPVDDWMRLRRFLILGSEGGTYYIGEQALTVECAEAVRRCLEADGPRVVETIVEISRAGRAPKNDPALFALAMAAGLGEPATRKAALAALPAVARTGTHLMHFAAFIEQFRGWGRGLREAVAEWYNRLEPGALAYQLVKYQSRDGWSHRDLLRLAHPQPADEAHRALYGWATSGSAEGLEGTLVAAHEQAKRATRADELIPLIREHRLTWEMLPTPLLGEPSVWEALLDDMPMTALLRNLARMTASRLIAPASAAARRVVEQLGDGERLRSARVHPIAVLSAMRVYAAGRGYRGKLSWQPVAAVVDALDAAFYAAFGAVEPSGARLVLALDVSGSMTAGMPGLPFLSCRDASAAMALVTAAVEPSYAVVAFSHQMVPIAVSPRQRLDDVLQATARLPFAATDCALPMLWAREQGVDADAFVIYTDSETWYGDLHPVQALAEYRQSRGIASRLVVVGMTSNGFTIADPDDGGMLDVVGFDTATPELVGDFVAARI